MESDSAAESDEADERVEVHFFWGVSSMGVLKMDDLGLSILFKWFINLYNGNPIQTQMDDLGIPLFLA